MRLFPALRACFLIAPLLSTACGGSDEAGAPGRAAVPTLVTQKADDPKTVILIEEMLRRLLETRTATADIIAALPVAHDPKAVALVNRLRTEILRRENGPWQAGSTDGYWGERRCCSVEALKWHRGIQLEVYRLRIPSTLAARFGGSPKYGALRVSKSECLRAAASDGQLLGAYGTITLRAGETARLVAGWTRARLRARVDAGRTDEICSDRFEGLRLAVSANASGGESGTWQLGVFTSWGALRSQTGVLAMDPDWIGQDQVAEGLAYDGQTRLDLTLDEQCWLGQIKGEWDKSESQVLLCARVVELE